MPSKRGALRAHIAPAALLLAAAGWLGCDALAGIHEGAFSSSDGGVDGARPSSEGGSPSDGGPADATADAAADGGDGSTATDFAISLGAPIVGVVQGSTGSVPVTITPQNGFAGAVAVTVSGLPSGVTATPLTLAAGTTSGTLTLSAAASATLGPGPTLTVTGTSGALSHTASVALLVQGPSGTLDTTFGNQGFVDDGTFAFADYGGMALQPDGKIVVCGTINLKNTTEAFVTRYDADGTPDTTFGPGADAGGPLETFPASAGSSTCNGVIVLSTGDIAFAGTAQQATSYTNGWVVALKPDGSLDPAFGTGGIGWWLSGTGTIDTLTATALAEDSSGNILATGSIFNSPLLVRLTAAGQADTTFGGVQGFVQGDYPGATTFVTVLATTGGDALVTLDTPTFAVQRYTASGLLDSTFFSQGTSVLSPGVGASNAVALAVQTDGNIVAAGQAVTSETDASSTTGVAAGRVSASGQPDTTYGADGGFAQALGTGDSWANDVAIDPWGRALLGCHIEGSTARNAFGVARMTTTGALDTSFAAGQGYVTNALGGGSATLFVAGLADGRILAGGATQTYDVISGCVAGLPCNLKTVLLARYWP